MDITPIIRAGLLLIGAVITAVIVPLIRAKLSEQQLANVQTWVKVAVEAAEQIYKGTGRGQDKKAFVLDFLDKKGLTLDFPSIDNMIEAAVLELKK